MTTSLWDLQDSSRGGVTITGSGFFNSSLITCFLTYQVYNSVQLTSLPAVYDSDVVVYCPIPINGNLSIQIANDGRRGSVGSAEVYSYNSSCQDCSQNPGSDVRCSTKEKKCMIKDACFDEADLDPGDSCYVCASKVSTATWTRKLDESCRQTNVWVFIWPSLLGIFLLLGTFSVVFLVRKYQKSGTYDLGKVQAKFEMGVFTITHSAQTQSLQGLDSSLEVCVEGPYTSTVGQTTATTTNDRMSLTIVLPAVSGQSQRMLIAGVKLRVRT
ncbi:uncharacterized protein LOC131944227 [Physella acuta]|uniref:uncharacterized protein LOC131944227 n=1 Tax=Physella acuta TaxID=109671 RepID=UPI0027DC01BE|nr:uncharacterized protein LOC131944227 [Physella acuta]